MLLSSMSGEKRTSFLGAEAPVWAHSADTRTTQTAKNFGKERMDILESRCRSQKCTLDTTPAREQFPDTPSHCIGREQDGNCQRNTTRGGRGVPRLYKRCRLEDFYVKCQVLLRVLANGFHESAGLHQHLIAVVVKSRIFEEQSCRALAFFQPLREGRQVVHGGLKLVGKFLIVRELADT